MKYWKDAEMMIPRVPSLAIATVDADGSPHVTPIGSLFTAGEGKCFYFEKLPRNLRDNLDRDGRFSVLVQHGGLIYWLKALIKGRFDTMPALRLSGTAGKRRQCTPEERALFDGRFRKFSFTKGYDILWKDMETVRYLHVESIIPVHLGRMTESL